jgi:hypothetical protein
LDVQQQALSTPLVIDIAAIEPKRGDASDRVALTSREAHDASDEMSVSLAAFVVVLTAKAAVLTYDKIKAVMLPKPEI